MKTVKLGNVCEFRRGLTYKKTDEAIESQNIVLRANNIALNGFKLNFDELKYISDTIEIPSIKYITKNTILICTASGSKSHLGKVALIDKDYGYAFGGFMGLLVPDHSLIDAKYLYLVLISKRFRELIDSLTDGTNINNLKFSLIQDFEFFLPSLEEQRRIVERLGAAFEKIDRAIELTEKNIKNADTLFGSLLNKAVRQNPDVEDKSVGEIADIEYGLTEKAKTKGDYRLIRITDIKSNGFLAGTNKVYVDASPNSEKYLLREGDIVVARTGATFGKVLYFEDSEAAVFASYLIRINFNSNIQPKLFWYFAKTPQYWEQANKFASGAAQPQFNGNVLKKISFSYPKDREEQTQIIHTLDGYHKSTMLIKDAYDKKLKKLVSLKQSLLMQAFSESAVE